MRPLLFMTTMLLVFNISASPSLGSNGPAFLVDDLATLASPDTAFNVSSVNNLTAVDNHFFFTSAEHRTGIELWRSDGTTAGTTIVKDINPGCFSFIPCLSHPGYISSCRRDCLELHI